MKSTHEVPTQEITLPEIHNDEIVIDIGAGSEALVSRITQAKVCAVDISISKIREAQIYQSGADWILGNAIQLGIQNAQFTKACLWFSLGYIANTDAKVRVFEEIHRVLKDSGRVSVLSAKIDCQEPKFHFRVKYKFPDHTISIMRYLVRGRQNQTIDSISSMITRTGFDIIKLDDRYHYFSIIATK
ncbi:MAG: methyltransferase domain-containing protein [Candidatus Lokiarchaeota archaeon]|nr:methyltransferase domain-containing protein [Candidatus Lokiarchaeota archaeon]